jgi:dTDP-4-dehydrorhamnose 3,5-epimerase-like enzyme
MPHDILSPCFQREDNRGTFQEILNEGHWESLIRGAMKAGAVMGHHFHRKTVIFFHLTAGSARIKTVHVETASTDQFMLERGKGVLLRPNESHSIRFLEDSEFIMLKSLRYNPEDPDTYPFPVED